MHEILGTGNKTQKDRRGKNNRRVHEEKRIDKKEKWKLDT
jgi:hypothetical protein